MSKQIYENKFKDSLLQFLDELIEQYPTYASIVIVRIYIKDSITAQYAINQFVKEVLPYNSFIIKKNSKLFTDFNVIYTACFGATKESNIKNLKNIWIKADKENRDAIWRWFEFFSTLCTKYHKKYMNDFDLTNKQKEINKKFNI